MDQATAGALGLLCQNTVWRVSGLSQGCPSHPIRHRHQPAKCPTGWGSKPPAAFWQRLYCQSRCSIHPITQRRRMRYTPPFVTVSPGSNYIPARNQQTHVRRQADTVSLVHCRPSYPAVTEPLGTDAAWSLVGKAQAFALKLPLLLSLNTCSFKENEGIWGKAFLTTSNSSDKKPLQNEMEM